ncbi:MAG: Transcription factor E [Candidatus Argoarchaeum ethanivorans]|uniref:Transcription factor E n=1 Tax=Candidatus Argoarchaeum ethanivorans TaxID=2608793 RepID=A0A811TJN9_9EURY|nr:MAG: Transcription factor E [Candidatus Argoarchaeum ethanivorans]
MIDLDDTVVCGYFHSLVGEEGMKVIKNMPTGEVTDEEISTVTEVMLNAVRRTLFFLYENRLASYRRERDTNSGWLTYLWRVDLSPLDSLLEDERKKLLTNLEKRLLFEEENMFYTCKNKCGRCFFDDAVELNFVCPGCGEKLMHHDNEEVIKVIKKRILQLNPKDVNNDPDTTIA